MREVNYLDIPNFPIAPAWSVTDKELVLATFPQNVKAYLAHRSNFRSLAETKEVAAAVQSESPPMAIGYQNTRQLFAILYPIVEIVDKFATSEFAREGVKFDLSAIPSAPSITRHLQPSVSVVRQTREGIEIVSRQTLPAGNIGASPPWPWRSYFQRCRLRSAGRGGPSSTNNLKQIALAMHMYADTYKTFPPAYKADKEGKPLLSWRVLILPFIEQNALYNQFHLDEPWNSEHNRKLIAQMPSTYRSPVSHAAPGKTTYLTVRGKDTIFPGKEAIGFADITDGTSNTALVVEVSDAKAVEWTRPDDFAYDPENPGVGLFGAYPGGTNLALADGSVRFISDGIQPEILDRLFNRHDGQVIPYERSTLLRNAPRIRSRKARGRLPKRGRRGPRRCRELRQLESRL